MIVSFVVVIGILILIHELGHFFVARWCGVGVERFSIGFGPVLFRWRGKETEYVLSAIPMGGYVKMMGEENPLEGGAALPFDAKKAFALKPLWARFLIVFAGPGMNFVLAAFIFAVVLATVGRPVWPAAVGKVTEASPAAAAGLRTGDVITALNDKSVAYWEDLERAVAESNGRPLTLRVRRADAEQALTLTPRRKAVTDPIFKESREVWDIGAGPQLIPQIGWSDQWSFWQFGYKAVMVTDTAPFRNPHYHMPHDTPETLDYVRLAIAVDGLSNVIRVLSE